MGADRCRQRQHPSPERIDRSTRVRGGRVVREERLGLTHARLRGHAEASGKILVFVDDDNLLDDPICAAPRRRCRRTGHWAPPAASRSGVTRRRRRHGSTRSTSTSPVEISARPRGTPPGKALSARNAPTPGARRSAPASSFGVMCSPPMRVRPRKAGAPQSGTAGSGSRQRGG